MKKNIKINKIILFLFIVVAIAIITLFYKSLKYSNSQDLDVWLGKYIYYENKSYGEMIDWDEYEIIIYKVDDNYYAELTGEQWKSHTRSLAYVKGDDKLINIYFLQTLPGDMLYGQSMRYNKNDLLMTFTYNNSELQSIWGALQKEYSSSIDEKMEGIYFVKFERRK